MNGISKESLMKADADLRDEMLIEMQYDTYERVNELHECVVPMKTSVKWLTWGFRALFVSLVGMAFFVIRGGV